MVGTWKKLSLTLWRKKVWGWCWVSKQQHPFLVLTDLVIYRFYSGGNIYSFIVCVSAHIHIHNLKQKMPLYKSELIVYYKINISIFFTTEIISWNVFLWLRLLLYYCEPRIMMPGGSHTPIYIQTKSISRQAFVYKQHIYEVQGTHKWEWELITAKKMQPVCELLNKSLV